MLTALTLGLLALTGSNVCDVKEYQINQDLQDALDLLLAPAAFRLEYRTTKIGGLHPSAEVLREFIQSQGNGPDAFHRLSALVEELRENEGITDPSLPQGEASCYIGATTEYRISTGATYHYQEVCDSAQGMPELLWTPHVSVAYYRSTNRLEFMDSSVALDLRNMGSMISPLPLSTVAREHWLPLLTESSKISENEVLLSADDSNLILSIKCTAFAPNLPVAAWVNTSGSTPKEMRIGTFIFYAEQDGAIVPRAVFSVRESLQMIRIDEYVFREFERSKARSPRAIEVLANPRIVDKTAGRIRRLGSIEELPAAWRTLVSTARQGEEED